MNNLKITTIGLLILSLYACNDNNKSQTSNYNANTNEAVITMATINAYVSNSSNTANSANTANSKQTKSNSKNIKQFYQLAQSTLHQHTSNMLNTRQFSPAAAEQTTVTINCDVSGTSTIESHDNIETDEFWVSIISDNCKNADGSFSDGNLAISGVIDTVDTEKNTFIIDFDNYIARDSLSDTVTDGHLESTGDKNLTITMNLVLEDKILKETVKYEDINVTVITELSKATVDLSGKIYSSTEGYVTIKTTQSIVTYTADLYPSAGQFVIVGASSVNNKKATIEITYLPSNMYTVRADLDGDGVFEIDQTCDWNQECLIVTP